MSLDNIVRINISSGSLSVQRAGFGIPMLLGNHERPDIVKAYSSEEEMVIGGFKEDGPLVQMAKSIFLQSPTVPFIKVGKLEAGLDAIRDADSDFYGVLLASRDPKIIESTSDWVENKRLLLGADCSDPKLAERLKRKEYKRTFLCHGSIAAPLMAKMFSLKPGEASWAFQQLKGIAPTPITSSQEITLNKHHINYFSHLKGLGITLGGKVVSGEYIDVIRGIDWLHARMQERIFGLMVKNKKIPFTDKGVDLIRSEIMAQLEEAIEVRILADDPRPLVTAPPVADIPGLDKQNRTLPSVKFTGQLQGAIHQIQIEGSVNA